MDNIKINTMIVGAQKAGTTSLKKYLGQHPSILTNYWEFPYFVIDEIYKKKYKEVFHEFFDEDSKSFNHVLAKNVGVMYYEKAIKRLYRHNPDCKIIAVLRDPVSRAISAYQYAKNKGWEHNSSFQEAIISNKSNSINGNIYNGNCDYIGRGMYYDQLIIILKYFDRKQLKVINFEDINERTIFKELFEFLEVDNSFKPTLAKKHNQKRVPRSYLVSKIIASLKMPSFLKKLFSIRLRSRVKKKLYRLNSVEGGDENISKNSIHDLSIVFKENNKLLAQEFSINTDNWA